MGKRNRQRRAEKRRNARRQSDAGRSSGSTTGSTSATGSAGSNGGSKGFNGSNGPGNGGSHGSRTSNGESRGESNKSGRGSARGWADSWPGTGTPTLEEMVMGAAVASTGVRPEAVGPIVDGLARGCYDDHRRDELSQTLSRLLVAELAGRWHHGWQPADLAHAVGRQLRAGHRRICADVIGLHAERYRYAPGADPNWLAQVDAVKAAFGTPAGPDATGNGESEPVLFGQPRPTPLPPSLLDRWDSVTGGLADALLCAVETLGMLHVLGPLPHLCPPPSDWSSDRRTRSTGRAPDPKITERVRALLAKAESTNFPDEAEAFTAKAQELIARHAIDLAMLEGEQPTTDTTGRRVLIDDPYGRAKSILVSVIAEVNRCRAVFSEWPGFTTVFGAPNDIAAVELLYTSLLTQATAAMTAAGRTGGAQARGRSFRQSFLVAFANRIGERLEQATSSAVDDARAQHGDNVLPVLASRDAAAEEARDEAFPQLTSQQVGANSYQGWVAGQAAADLARLGPDAELQGSHR